MTSLRQIEANRRNALKSTGPITDAGKQRASRNAVRHGLTAETVIEPHEDPGDYKAFEQSVTADYEAETAVERELVLRLASLLWRLRRAAAIETGLFQIQGDCDVPVLMRSHDTPIIKMFRLDDPPQGVDSPAAPISGMVPVLPRYFIRLASIQDGAFELLGRYELALWRQVRQTLFTLERLRWITSTSRNWRKQRSWSSVVRRPVRDDDPPNPG